MPSWAQYILDAWYALGDDRHRYDSGGCSKIWYASISAYAKDHSLSGEGFDIFYRFLRAMDGEYVTHTAEQVKIAMDKAKRGQETRHDG